jgi:hypothetical protein
MMGWWVLLHSGPFSVGYEKLKNGHVICFLALKLMQIVQANTRYQEFGMGVTQQFPTLNLH